MHHHHRLYLRSRARRHASPTLGAMYVQLDWHRDLALARSHYRYIRNLQRVATPNRKHDEADATRARRLILDLLFAGTKPGFTAQDWTEAL